MSATYVRSGKKPAISLRAGVSILAMIAVGAALGTTPAVAGGGTGGPIIFSSPVSAGGTDGTLQQAVGQDGAFIATASNGQPAGGGAVDLTTGNGAHGGARGIGGITIGVGQVLGTPGATGAAGMAVTSPTTLTTSITGGAGGAGEANVNNVHTAGGGGGGGVGITTSADVTIAGTSSVTGGKGFNQVGAGSGGGGSGVFSSATVMVDTGGQITGGAGGGGGTGGAATNAGGGGGMGAVLATGGGLINSGSITGGVGGIGGATVVRGGGGDGGAGVWVTGGGTVVNAAGGTIAGGVGGAGRFDVGGTHGGLGGEGVKGSDVTLINAGTISAAMGGANTGGTAPVIANAVTFLGGVNALEIQAGSVINGNVIAFSAADTLKLGGTTDSSFDISQIGASAQYRGFGIYAKTGSSTWTLTGTTTAVTPWTISQGILRVSGDGQLGDAAGALTFNGGTLSTTDTFDMNRTISLVQAGQFDVATGTELGLTGAVSGSDLVKSGVGTLRLDNTGNAYGNTFVEAGTLVGNAATISGNIGNAGTVVFNQASDGNFAGEVLALAGIPGSMVKKGSGNLTLDGTSSLDWSIQEGGLTTAAERFGGNVDISSVASLTFNEVANASYAGGITGTGGFAKTGAGTLAYDGDGSGFSGTTIVSAGGLVVGSDTAHTGAVLGGSIDVESGALLGGHGTVGSGAGSTVTVEKGATIAPGNSIGTLTIDGDYKQEAGSTYQAEIAPDGSSDLIKATGTATLGGGTVFAAKAPGGYAPGSRYTILTAAGGVTGIYDTLDQNTPFVDLSLAYDPGAVYLDVTRNAVTFPTVGITSNQKASAAGAESLGAGNALYDAIAGALDAETARTAFDAVSGEIHASAKTVLLENSRFARDAATDRIREAFCGADAKATIKGEGMDSDASPTPADCTANADRVTGWAQAVGSWGHTDGNGNAAALDRAIGGFFTGLDAPIGGDWRMGVLAGYTHSTFDVGPRNSSGYSKDYHVGLYGGTQKGALGFRAGAIHTWHDIGTSRSVAFPGFSDQLDADYHAGTTQIFGDLGYRLNAGAVALEPFANLAYVNLHTNGFKEKGGAAALAGSSGNMDTTFTTIGVRASVPFAIGGVNAVAKGSIGWRHAFGDIAPDSTLAFAGGTPFEIAGVPVGKDSAITDVGVEVRIAGNASLGISYAGRFASNAVDQGVRGTLQVKF